MKDILQEIIDNKRMEVLKQKEAVPLESLIELTADRFCETRSMRAALEKSTSGIIAEFKRKSPSKGWLHPEAEIAEIVPAYEKGSASACSILTDHHYFGGSLSDLQKARELVKLPLLRKDFIIDSYQLYQAKLMGADAILLIAACLTKDECRALAETAHLLKLEVLLEIHKEEELEYVGENIDMLGVNNRNLGTFDTDINNSFRLMEKILHLQQTAGKAPLLIAESGISDPKTVLQLRQAGFKGFLIGETFMKTKQPGKTLSSFIKELS